MDKKLLDLSYFYIFLARWCTHYYFLCQAYLNHHQVKGVRFHHCLPEGRMNCTLW